MSLDIKKYVDELNQRVEDGAINKNNAEFLIKLMEKANSLEEIQTIMGLGTTYKKTGFHFDFRKENPCSNIKYLKKNEELSFEINKDSLTHKLIIGDNYDALRQLLITHRGKIDIIYIDPPYGCDSMGEFAEVNYTNGISRDNLLSSLRVRLDLAKDLLSETGVIFCSIDDRNHAYLKCLFDDVFEEKNFVGDIIWKKNSNKNNSKTLSINHEYILCYAKNISYLEANSETQKFFTEEKKGLREVYKILQRCEKAGKSFEETEEELKNFYRQHQELKGISQYDHVDWGPLDEKQSPEAQRRYQGYTLSDVSAPQAIGKAATYEVIHPKTGIPCKCPTTGWRFTWDTMQENIRKGLIYFYEDETKVPRFKRYLDTVPDDVFKSLLEDFTDGKKELQEIFGDSPFANPKPTTLIKTLIRMMTRVNKNAIILDFYAGSGTTGQAVLDLNREDGGHRHFILCTNNEITDENPNGIAYDVTAERLKRIMTGKNYNGSNDFPWITKKKCTPYGDNLEVTEISEVSPTASQPGKTPFDIIDEKLYGFKFDSIEAKINWVCTYFKNTMKTIESDEDYQERWGE